jgi:hypothetical protein
MFPLSIGSNTTVYRTVDRSLSVQYSSTMRYCPYYITMYCIVYTVSIRSRYCSIMYYTCTSSVSVLVLVPAPARLYLWSSTVPVQYSRIPVSVPVRLY